MQPLWAQMDALMTVLTIPRLGRNAPTGSTGCSSLDRSVRRWRSVRTGRCRRERHWTGIAVAVSRRTAEGDPPSGWTPDEILPIERALSAYTAGVSEQAFSGHVGPKWGTIVPGASADLVWLGRDPRSTAALDVPNIEIRATYLRGERVHPAR